MGNVGKHWATFYSIIWSHCFSFKNLSTNKCVSIDRNNYSFDHATSATPLFRNQRGKNSGLNINKEKRGRIEPRRFLGDIVFSFFCYPMWPKVIKSFLCWAALWEWNLTFKKVYVDCDSCGDLQKRNVTNWLWENVVWLSQQRINYTHRSTEEESE